MLCADRKNNIQPAALARLRVDGYNTIKQCHTAPDISQSDTIPFLRRVKTVSIIGYQQFCCVPVYHSKTNVDIFCLRMFKNVVELFLHNAINRKLLIAV